ncbi:MAG: hypothetical protein WD988_03150 [Candidatus Curtissbacteria bacterium]
MANEYDLAAFGFYGNPQTPPLAVEDPALASKLEGMLSSGLIKTAGDDAPDTENPVMINDIPEANQLIQEMIEATVRSVFAPFIATIIFYKTLAEGTVQLYQRPPTVWPDGQSPHLRR